MQLHNIIYILFHDNKLTLLHWLGIALQLPTKLNPTLHITSIQLTTQPAVVFGIGEDAEDPDICKRFRIL